MLAIVSSLLASAAFPPLDMGLVAWIALAPFLFSLRSAGAGRAAGLGFLFGFLHFFVSFFWSLKIPQVTFPILVASSSLSGLYFSVFGCLHRFICRDAGRWGIVGVPALWVALEYARSNALFLALPWNLLGHSQRGLLPVIQIADITGVYGLSFLIVMFNHAISEIPDRFRIRREGPAGGDSRNASTGNPWIPLLGATLALVLVLSYGWYRLSCPAEGKRLRVALVQTNVLTRDDMTLKEQLQSLLRYEEFTMQAARQGPALIVWPASSLPGPITFKWILSQIERISIRSGCYLLVGGSGREKDSSKTIGAKPSYANSEFLFSPQGRMEAVYNKVYLLPFNEFIPLKDHIRWPRWISANIPNFKAGEKLTLFQVSDGRFGTPICWENMFPDFFRRFVASGANFMVGVTNEGFMGDSAGPYQSLAMYVFRAVENRIAMVRSSPTGISAIIQPDGRVTGRVEGKNGKDLYVSGVLIDDIPLANGKSFYTRHGDVFALATIGALALLIPTSAIRSFRRKPS